jgi:hypothetical protein
LLNQEVFRNPLPHKNGQHRAGLVVRQRQLQVQQLLDLVNNPQQHQQNPQPQQAEVQYHQQEE